MSTFPTTRMRRLRRSDRLRALVRETRLDLDDFVLPLFVGPATEPNPELPAMGRFSVDHLVAEAADAARLGVRAVLLFGIPDEKDADGSGAWDEDGVIQRALRALRESSPGLVLLTDVCLCEYTSQGHCGVLDGEEVDNDATLELLARTAVSHASAGADAVCPSDMMDGRVAAIRAALDEEGHGETPIVSYAAKYASAFYGPFREAADSTPAFGDRRGYQLDPANVREALRECELDVAEGADALLVKPALPNLDVIRAARERFDLPVGAYNVSGEYAMLKAAGARGCAGELVVAGGPERGSPAAGGLFTPGRGALRARARDDLRGLPAPLRTTAAVRARRRRHVAAARRLPVRARSRPRRPGRAGRGGERPRRADFPVRPAAGRRAPRRRRGVGGDRGYARRR